MNNFYVYQIMGTDATFWLLPDSMQRANTAELRHETMVYKRTHVRNDQMLSKMSIRRMFRMLTKQKYVCVGVNRWSAHYDSEGSLHIGCQTFHKDTVVVIKRWAGVQ